MEGLLLPLVLGIDPQLLQVSLLVNWSILPRVVGRGEFATETLLGETYDD